MNHREENTHGGAVVELPLGDAAPEFNLEKAVCSHGLFMMAPNHWNPLSKTLQRPLRLDHDVDQTSFVVHISHPPHSPHALHLRVSGTRALSPLQQQSLLDQVRRMLRLSDEENRMVKKFHEVHEEAKGRGFGRVFRSPTLFEDIIKCILLCNCQWSRTLSMAQALCELQAELQDPSFSASIVKAESGTISSHKLSEVKQIAPKTPAGKESRKRSKVHKCSKKLVNKYTEILVVEETGNKISNAEISQCSQETGELSQTSTDACKTNLGSNSDLQPLEGTENCDCTKIGNFPSPKELASLDEKFLAKRCGLGYRAARVINLARGVVGGTIQLRDLEYSCGTPSSSGYDVLFEKLRMIDGFGPFTCANVLTCMGFYHVVPTDSETIRHLKQVHGKSSTIQTVKRDVEVIYEKYAPFQFLAYWAEVWHFYEEWFGNLSEMPRSSYGLITAANMRSKTKPSKRMKLFLENTNNDFAEKVEA